MAGPLQAKFLEALVIPMYRELASTFPGTKCLLDNVQSNCAKWAGNHEALEQTV